jgi:hypothetical protein
LKTDYVTAGEQGSAAGEKPRKHDRLNRFHAGKLTEAHAAVVRRVRVVCKRIVKTAVTASSKTTYRRSRRNRKL